MREEGRGYKAKEREKERENERENEREKQSGERLDRAEMGRNMLRPYKDGTEDNSRMARKAWSMASLV